MFSILTGVYEPPLDVFAETVASVLAQTFDDWEWVIVDDCSPSADVREEIERLASVDPRIRILRRPQNGGIAAASNDALAASRGTFVALLDHDDTLTPDALEVCAGVVADDPAVDYLYGDQDLVGPDGNPDGSYLRPDWSPERLRHTMYPGRFSVLRRSLVDEVGGFRAGFDGAQEHDLVLRVTERARSVVHVPTVLHHGRAVSGAVGTADAAGAGVRAVQDHLDRVGIRGTAAPGRQPGLYVVRREPDTTTSVSVVIPTIGSVGLVHGRRRVMVTEAIRSLAARTAHVDVEFVVVYDTPTPQFVLDELRALPANVRLVEFTEPFNFSRKCNVGAIHARGDVLMFVNDDVEAISPDVIEQLIAPLRESDVGVTGPRLLFPNTSIQHAGLVYGGGTVAHAYYRLPGTAVGVFNDLLVNRETSALTGACIAVRREVFWEVGGFSEALPMNYNDVDFSLKVRRLGYRLLWLANTSLFHFESITRDNAVHPWETAFLVRRWGDYRRMTERYVNRGQ